MRYFGIKVNSYFLFFALWVLSLGCRRTVVYLRSPQHYDFSSPIEQKLNKKMNNIDGIAWDADKNSFAVINNEKGKISYLKKETDIVREEVSFTDTLSFIDISILDGKEYLLRADGSVYKVAPGSKEGEVKTKLVAQVKPNGQNEFGAMYADRNREALVVLCKTCAADNGSVSAYGIFPDADSAGTDPLYRINTRVIDKLSPFSTSAFLPSAACINPALRKLFIISASSRQLVITDMDGNVDSVYKLSHTRFPNPDGITFRPDGDMFIANKGEGNASNILQFVFSDFMGADSSYYLSSGYDLSTPIEKMTPSEQLHEISGMAYIPSQNLILAEQDQKGNIYTVDFNRKTDTLPVINFGPKGDWEDIVYTPDATYMLLSSGSITQVINKNGKITTQDFPLPGNNNEFETLYLDTARNSLIMLCKECSHEKKTEVRTAYRFDLKSLSYADEPAYIIDVNEVRKLIKDSSAIFKPSAAAINPLNDKLYILASVGKLLVIADKKTGKPEKAYRLDPQLYNQPEGMTFAPNGDLYISNEGGQGLPSIYKFIYRK
jgi:uncharacterized protein YjiK